MNTIAGVLDRRGHRLSDCERERFTNLYSSDSASYYDRSGILIAQTALPPSHSPITESPGGNVIGWTGRLDNRDEVLNRLGRGLEPAASDAAVALAMYEKSAENALTDLVGDWSLAIFHAATRQVTLASDYAGVVALYYHLSGDRLSWSSSLPQLIRWTGVTDIDDDFIARFLARGSGGSRTPYLGILAVRPGHAVCVSGSGAQQKRIWQLCPDRTVYCQEQGQYEERFRTLFEDAVRSRLAITGSVCAELSGGLDSTSVVCMAHRLIERREVPAAKLITISYHDRESQDERFYEAVEQALGLDAVHLETDSFPFVTESSTGGAAPGWWTERHRKIAGLLQTSGSNVLLSGRGGDLIMGNWLDDSNQVADSIGRKPLPAVMSEALAWSRALRVPVYSILWRALIWNLRPHSFVLNAQLSSATLSEDGDSLRSAVRRRAKDLIQADGSTAILKQASAGRRKHYLALSHLIEDRTLCSPEPLNQFSYTHPYLHRPLVEFMLGIPAHIVCGPGEPRRLMRRALKDLVPPPILQRRSKATFNTVFSKALRPLAVELGRATKNMTLATRGFVNPDSLHARLQRFLAGMECNEPQLRNIILLEFWLRGHSQRPE